MERQQPNKSSRADKGIGRMLLLSLVLHVGAIAAVVMADGQHQQEPVALKAYTVALIDPAALGGGLPPGPRKAAGQQSKAVAKAPDKPAPAVAPKPPNPPQVKDKPVETVKQSPPASLKPKKELVKLPTKEKSKKEKKPKQKKIEKKEKPKPQAEKKTVTQKKKIEKKQAKKVASKQPESPKKKPKRKKDTPVKKVTPKPKKIAKKTTDSVSVQERDERRLSAAIKRIRKNVESKSRPSGQAGARPQGRGGGSSGGGGVQGFAFMMYTEQVKQRVKEGWIVAQEKLGLTAVVQFGVRPSGDIVGVELARSSGNSAFDQSVLRAVHNANPLPPPPPEYQQEFLSQKVKVAFGK